VIWGKPDPNRYLLSKDASGSTAPKSGSTAYRYWPGTWSGSTVLGIIVQFRQRTAPER
jgi:hypothetical protein